MKSRTKRFERKTLRKITPGRAAAITVDIKQEYGKEYSNKVLRDINQRFAAKLTL